MPAVQHVLIGLDNAERARRPAGVFNVASTRPQAQLTPPDAQGSMIAFAVSLRAGRVHLVEERG